MYRSYFFALLACAFFSCAALVNAYQNLPPVQNSQVPGRAFSVSASLPSQKSVQEPAAEQEYPGRCAGEHKENGRAQTLEKNAFGEASILPAAASTGSSLPAPAMSSAGEKSGGSGNSSAPENVSSKGSQAGPKGSLSYYSPSRIFPDKSQGRSASAEVIPLNAYTDNFNILLLGVDGSKLEMVCLYSINHNLKDELKSVSLFFPVNSVLLYKGREKTLTGIFASGGWEAVAEAVGKAMYIDIHKYVKIDRQALRDLEKYFDPIYVDGKKVEMETLFVRRTSSEDDRIIARILKQVLRPEVFFRYIPGIVFGINRDIESNFSFTPKDLAFYYQIGKRLSTKRIEKIVLTGETRWQDGRRVNIPPKDTMASAIYRTTKP